ncbi:MAG: hypothetical protein RL227_2686, partial [Pseudomonadota bacterium]
MKALDRKLLRDLRLMWSQLLTIALVVASGVAGFITTLSAVDSLALARERFYASAHFADVFASVKRAPNALAETLRATPGVADLQTGIEQVVRIEIEGSTDPMLGLLVGLDPRAPPRLNRVFLQRGRELDAA